MNKQLQIAIGKLIGKDYFKLEFGCLLQYKNDEPYILLKEIDAHNVLIYYKKTENIEEMSNDELEILGTEPTLQDVLLAIPKCTEIYLDLKEGLIFEIGLGRGRIYYDLNLSVFNQTDEVKQQLLELMS